MFSLYQLVILQLCAYNKYKCTMRLSSRMAAGAQFEGDLGEIFALGAEISPYISLREKWESP